MNLRAVAFLVPLAGTLFGCTRVPLDAMRVPTTPEAGVADSKPDLPIDSPVETKVDTNIDITPDITPDTSPDITPDTKIDSGIDTVADTNIKPSCPSPVLKPGDTNMTILVGGVERSYLLHIPGAYNGTKPVPLVVDFHGLVTSGKIQRSNSQYPAVTDPEGVVMAFPSGLAGPAGAAWNAGPCCVAGVNDEGFARALVAQVQTTACIDAKRIYAVGFSMGGGMAYQLACNAADVFAAVAPFAFDMFKENVAGCTPPRPISVISFRGTGDTLIPYGGGPSSVVLGMPVTFLGAVGTFQKWAEINQCTGSPSGEDSNGCASYTNCPGGTEVTLCTKQGAGQEYGNGNVAWSFLKRHPMP